MRKLIFIGAAWPYANGSLHLGHIASLLGSDILARYYRLNQEKVLFISGSDCHGTPIAVQAEKRGVDPSEIAEKYHQEFKDNLINGLSFSYDLFSKTIDPFHQKLVQKIFLDLYQKGYIYKKKQKLPYCPKCQRFLPDRYVEGTCPYCGFEKARGDQCDECGRLLSPEELKNPHCQICGTAPIWKTSEHFFFRLSAFQKKLKKWVNASNGWRINALHLTQELLKKELPDRAITRDLEWGIPVPLKGYEDKKIYVWFEAVCGYLSASQEWAENQGNKDAWQEFWLNKKALHYYVHGKDNILFHTIIWPAILMAYNSDFHLPDKIISSEYLTLEKRQFSTSRDWAVWIPDFLAKYDSETIRYYLSINGPEAADADFSWSEYQSRINNELVNNFSNFIYRVFSMIQKNFPNGINFPSSLNNNETKILELARKTFPEVGQAIENAKFKKGIKLIFKLVAEGNYYLDQSEPWKKIKGNLSEAENILAISGQIIRSLAILINPYLPLTSQRISRMIEGEEIQGWQYPEPMKKLKLKEIKPLFGKVEV
ncbi:MAG TPA: methionine--tRNA ligase [Candidatus Portnoybacteria bacterium]|nr:methionine--tRNA ligase [Candidatus Portnoybacteria bacterium]